jgi:hypothetical protein
VGRNRFPGPGGVFNLFLFLFLFLIPSFPFSTLLTQILNSNFKCELALVLNVLVRTY